MAIKCVIFDLGDTVWSTKKAKREMKPLDFDQKWLAANGFRFGKARIREARAKTEIEARITSLTAKGTYGKYSFILLKNLGIKATKRMALKAEDEYYAEFDRHLKLMPNARRILSWLNREKFTVLALTNAHTKPQKHRLRKMDLMRHFNKVFISESLDYEKSSVVPFRIALKWLKPKGIKAAECLMVGNDYVEDASAKKAGIKTVILTANASKKDRAAAKPDYEIKDLIELKEIIRKLNERK